MRAIQKIVAVVLCLLLAACGADPAPMTWEQFRAQVYQMPGTGIFIVNGDEPVQSEAALREFFGRLTSQQARAQLAEQRIGVSQQGLIVNRVGSTDDKWSSGTASNITYCISSVSFGTNYTTVVNAMHAAAAAWKATGASINFVHASTSDGSCTRSTTNVLFNVRLVTNQPFLATAFFPSWTRSSRELLIDTTAFYAAWSLTGILRHELGHALGFRHEHTRPEAGVCFEDNSWRALTAYDSASVMHYPQCNGTNRSDLVLTVLDSTGARALYPAPAPPPSNNYSTSFETGISQWTNWQNCSTNGTGSVTQYYTAGDYPAPGGGSYALRLHTAGFTIGCLYPGTYSLSPSIPATAGVTYRVDNMSRNAGNSGQTALVFYNAAGTEIALSAVSWSNDGWQYNADAPLTVTAPAGTASMRVRYGLSTPNEYADMDLLKVYAP